ncbi:hypothetical protein [Phenylobacterium sp.]|uniref:hypothetical protein n=1 Tax=Phenylobacterium sp. TaxID=1871053 RepID=UPI002FCBDBA3
MKSSRYAFVTALALVMGTLAGCGDKADKGQGATAPAPPKSVVIFQAGLVGNDFQPVNPPANTVDIVTDPSGSVVANLIRSTVAQTSPEGDTNTAIVRMTPEDMPAISGKTATVVVTARSAAENGSPSMRMAYSRAGVASSGWQEVALKPEFADYSFTYDVPAEPSTTAPRDFIAVWGDPEGKGRGVEVSRVRIAYYAQ